MKEQDFKTQAEPRAKRRFTKSFVDGTKKDTLSLAEGSKKRMRLPSRGFKRGPKTLYYVCGCSPDFASGWNQKKQNGVRNCNSTIRPKISPKKDLANWFISERLLTGRGLISNSNLCTQQYTSGFLLMTKQPRVNSTSLAPIVSAAAGKKR
jgi:hypothetical protein